MKIKRLERNECGRFEMLDLVDKVNEIIDLLNNSFITNDPDTVYGSVTDSLPTERLTTITCDRLTSLTNETTCELTIDYLDNMVDGGGVYNGIKCPKCPKCGAKYFTVGPSVSTCVYYPPIIKDGVNINPDRNTSTTQYECLECGHVWKETE